MPPVAAEPPDTEVLDGAPFMRGGWPDQSIALDVGFSQVAEALGDGVMLESTTPETLLAVVFAAGDSSRLLKITPMHFVGEWEATIDDRAGLEDMRRAGRQRLYRCVGGCEHGGAATGDGRYRRQGRQVDASASF